MIWVFIAPGWRSARQHAEEEHRLLAAGTLRNQGRALRSRRRRFTTTMKTFARASPIPQSRSFFLCAFAALREFFFSSRQDAKTLRSDNQRGVSERALSLWTSRPMKWIRLLMGVGFLSGSAMELRCSVLFELVDRRGAPHTRTLGNPRLQPESNTHSL
jgi:hypothetical protein